MRTQEVISLHNIQKEYGIKRVLNGAELTLSQGERVALVGENGIGKSTIARIITGLETADGGTLFVGDGVQIGYLPQEVSGDDTLSVQAYVEEQLGSLHTLRETMTRLEASMSLVTDPTQLSTILEDYGVAQALFEARGGYDLDTRMTRIFAGLGIDYIDSNRILRTLSGGERTRVALATLLLREPDLLVLDEPTNHLDFAGIAWLENYLANYERAILLITHDRVFINRVANVIAELHPVERVLTVYHGTYDDYLNARHREYEEQVENYNSQNNEIKLLQRTVKELSNNRKITGRFSDDGDKFLRNFKKARGEDLVSKMVRDSRHQLEQVIENKMKNPRHEWTIDFRFDPEPLMSAEPVRLEQVSKQFEDRLLFDGVTAVVPRGERVVLVAPNGTGKTTLLHLIMGWQKPTSGHIHHSPSAIFGYLDQDGETLNPDQTVLDCYREVIQGTDSDLLAELHRSGLFSDSTLGQKRVRDLSVGQRRKLGLARLVASRANVLLLDEPTNHLDPMSLEALEDALIQFNGTLLAVSHDRRFVEKVATRIWRIEAGHLTEEIITE